MKCRWIDDKCQHGYNIDDAAVTFHPGDLNAGGTTKSKFLCPKGEQA